MEKKKKMEEKNEHRKKKWKQINQIKPNNKNVEKKIISLFLFKWNLFFTLKIIIILIISVSYYLVSMIIESNNK